jgi:hypothetical protein
VHLPALILRPVLFAFIFFVVGALVQQLISNFLPDLLSNEAPAEESNIGTRFNIEESDDSAAAPAAPAAAPAGPVLPAALPDEKEAEDGGAPESVGDISVAAGVLEPLPAPGGGVDQSSKGEYTDKGDSFGDFLPDLDSLAGAFKTGDSEDGEDQDFSVDAVAAASGTDTDGEPSKSGKGEQLDGNYSPKEIAEGIRTMLSKDKEG